VTGAAESVVARLTESGLTVAVAESLTGGLLGAALTDVTGASAVFRGGVTAYATELKVRLLGLDAALLAEHGPVDPRVATGMAEGVRRLMEADWGLSTTGVAGPSAQDGAPVGTVFVGCSGPLGTVVRRLALSGDRAQIRTGSVVAALQLLSEQLAAQTAGR
jgi:nicotinamide-nucleotide amidase